MLGFLLERAGAVPVRPRADTGGTVDNSAAFEELGAVLADGQCFGIFPEGISHVNSRLATIKTGTARVALDAARGQQARVTIVPCGLNYLQCLSFPHADATLRHRTSMGTSRRAVWPKRPGEGVSPGPNAAEYHPGVAARNVPRTK